MQTCLEEKEKKLQARKKEEHTKTRICSHKAKPKLE